VKEKVYKHIRKSDSELCPAGKKGQYDLLNKIGETRRRRNAKKGFTNVVVDDEGKMKSERDLFGLPNRLHQSPKHYFLGSMYLVYHDPLLNEIQK